eukprot:c6206_g1_i1.p1 GENE.c6206_g1_i1~~c6206_g1_i1.p1  ORF type:complete len:355 (+),score=49.20 c6206_g1_i1:1013-2077(+)
MFHTKGTDLVVRLRGIPYRAAKADLVTFLDCPSVTVDCVHILFRADGRPTGDAFVEVPDSKTLEQVMLKHREKIGSRYIEIFRASEAELRLGLQGWSGQPQPMMHPGMMHPSMMHHQSLTHHGMTQYHPGMMQSPYEAANPYMSYYQCADCVVWMRGLPFSANELDIRSFFSDVAVPLNVSLLLNRQGKASGEGFAEFATEVDVTHALACHGRTIGNRYVEVFRVSRADVPEKLVLTGQTVAYSGYEQYQNAAAQSFVQTLAVTPTSAPGSGPTVVKMRGLPFAASTFDIVDFCSGYDILRDSIKIGVNQNNRPSGEAWVEFTSMASAQNFIRTKNRTAMGNRYIELFLTHSSA